MTSVRNIPARNCAGALEAFLVLVLLPIVGTASAGTPLEPVDTSSPRATLGSFLALTDEATEIFSEYRRAPSPGLQAQLVALGEEGMRLLDLSQVPPVARREVGSETLYLLWDILARVELPALDQVPGGAEGVEDADQGTLPKRWRIPHTEVTIARIQEGRQAGEYRFTADSVSPLFNRNVCAPMSGRAMLTRSLTLDSAVGLK